MELPTEVIHYINSYLSSDMLNTLILVNKNYREIYQKKIKEKIMKIQNFYKKNRMSPSYGGDLPYFMGWDKYSRFIRLLNQKKYYRKVLLWNSLTFLKRLPEKILARVSLNSSRYLILRDWISNNLEDVDLRKKSDIAYFLKFNRIRVNELLDAGV